MTIIVWDGKKMVADKQATVCGTKMRVTKIHKINGSIIGVAGDHATAMALIEWFKNGKSPDKWPEIQKDKDRWSTMLEITPDRKIMRYEYEPYPFEVEEQFYAFGSGMDIALGAMEMGADGVKAVEIASKYLYCCGMGYDILELGND